MEKQNQFIYNDREIYCICKETLTVGFPVYCEYCSKQIALLIIDRLGYLLNIYCKYWKIKRFMMKKGKNTLQTKDLIFDAINDKLEGKGIDKLLLTFSLIDSTNSVSIKFIENLKTESFTIDLKDMTIIKRFFVNKIAKLIDSEKYKSIILQVKLIEKEFDIFLQNLRGEVVKFNY